MISKRDNEARMYHLSYDKKDEKDDNDKLKLAIIWSILGLDINAIISSPVASTITIESRNNYENWESMFNLNYRKRIYYVISEARQHDEHYLMDIELNEDLNKTFITKVESIRQEILQMKKLAEKK